MFQDVNDDSYNSAFDAPRDDNPLRILLVEDNRADAALVQGYLQQGLSLPFILEATDALAGTIRLLDSVAFDLILLDLTLSDSSGLETFGGVDRHCNGTPIVVLSGESDSELAVEAVRRGAQDYVRKSELNADTLGLHVRFAIERNCRVRAESQLTAAREQIRIARRLQRDLFPATAPVIEGFDIAGRAWTAEHACGDYFDFIRRDNGSLGLVVGDVSGHGLGAALKMVESRAALHTAWEYESDLNRLIGRVNAVFRNDELTNHATLFLTLFIGRLDPAASTLQFASAGHPAFRLDSAGSVERLQCTSLPVGLMSAENIGQCDSIQLNPDDIIVIPTDGFFEAGVVSRRILGIKGMMKVVRRHRERSAADILTAMYRAARDCAAGHRQEDDMAAIVVKGT